MTHEQTQQERLLALKLTAQSMLHQIEQISRNDKYKFELKQRTESYYKFLDKFTDGFIKATLQEDGLSEDEIISLKNVQDTFVLMVAKFDELAESVKINN